MDVTNRITGIDLLDRVPEDLWTEVHDIIQEAVIKTIPNKKKCKKEKWLSEEVLHVIEKRRDMKDKGEKERYIHLNSVANNSMKDKTAFLSDQCKEIAEINRI